MTDAARRPFGVDWWPEGVAYPRLRLAAGLAAASLIAALIAVGFAFVAAGTNFADEAAVHAQVTQLAGLLIIAFPVYAATVGLISVLGLWIARMRSILAFALAGGFGGGFFAVAVGAIMGHPVGSGSAGFFVVAGLVILLIARGIAGVRARPFG